MPSDLSQPIDLLHLAKSKKRIEGSMPLDSFERVKDVLMKNTDKLHYSLSFGFDESRTCVVETTIATSLVLECQRCLGPVTIEVHKSSLLGLIRDKDEADALDKAYEPLELGEDTISVMELIEDELLLAIPLSPLHDENECSGKEVLDQINEDAKPRPFAALAALKKN